MVAAVLSMVMVMVNGEPSLLGRSGAQHVGEPEEVAFAQASVTDMSNITTLRTFITASLSPVTRVQISRLFLAQDNLELNVAKRCARKPRALVVGANNGILADKLFPIIIAHEWQGLMIEAGPNAYSALLANYRRKHGVIWEGLHFRNVAVANASGMVDMDVSQPASMLGARFAVSTRVGPAFVL